MKKYGSIETKLKSHLNKTFTFMPACMMQMKLKKNALEALKWFF